MLWPTTRQSVCDLKTRKSAERGQKLEGRQCFEFLLGRNVVGVLEHAALLLREREILPRPGDEFVVRDEAVRFHSIEPRDGGELIVFNEHINFVVRALAVVPRDQKDFRGFVRIASTQIFVAQKGFELVVERSDFRASHFVRERKRDISALDLRSEMTMLRANAHMPRPEPIGGPRS